MCPPPIRPEAHNGATVGKGRACIKGCRHDSTESSGLIIPAQSAMLSEQHLYLVAIRNKIIFWTTLRKPTRLQDDSCCTGVSSYQYNFLVLLTWPVEGSQYDRHMAWPSHDPRRSAGLFEGSPKPRGAI